MGQNNTEADDVLVVGDVTRSGVIFQFIETTHRLADEFEPALHCIAKHSVQFIVGERLSARVFAYTNDGLQDIFQTVPCFKAHSASALVRCEQLNGCGFR